MGQIRTMPLANAFSGVTSSGDGVRHPAAHNWSAADAACVAGDRVTIDLLELQAPEPGYQIEYYEAAIEQRGAATRVEKVLYGPAVSHNRYFTVTTAATLQRVRVRVVQKLRNQFRYSTSVDNGWDEPEVGDTISQASTGASADIQTIRANNYAILENISGTFAESNTEFTFGGLTGYQLSPLHVPHTPADQVKKTSDWSAPVDVLPSAGSASVSITASKSRVIQGEGILLKAVPTGFDADKPLHDLHYHWTVAKAGEQGSFAALQDSYSRFEDEFGAGQNNRCEGFSCIWGFTPHTTGTVTISVTVRDRSGNVASNTFDLTVDDIIGDTAPAVGFAEADVYALTVDNTDVPGAAGATKYTTIESLVSAIPSTGEALIVIDTTSAHNAAAVNSSFAFLSKVPDRLAIMAYNGTGIGPAANASAEIDFAFKINQLNSILSFVNSTGPFDATNPNSHDPGPSSAGEPQEAWSTIESVANAHTSVDRCRLNGWKKGVEPVESGGTTVMTDLYMINFHDFGVHGGESADHVLCGVVALTDPLAWFYNDGKNDRSPPDGEGFFVDHPGYRVSRPTGDRGFNKCFFFCSVGWGKPPGSQMAVRMWGGAGGRYGDPLDFTNYTIYDTHLTECYFEAETALNFYTSASGGDLNFDAPQNVVVDKFVCHVAQQQRQAIGFGVGPLTFRNGRIVFPDAKGRADTSASAVFVTGNGGSNTPQFDVLNQPFVIENITAAFLQTDAQIEVSKEPVFFSPGTNIVYTDVTQRNILTYIPELAAATAAQSTDLETGSGLDATPRYTPLYEAYCPWNDTLGSGPGDRLAENLAQSIDTSWALSNTVSATFEPQTGSGAIGPGEANQPYDDIMSRVRTTSTTRTIGAYDPAGT